MGYKTFGNFEKANAFFQTLDLEQEPRFLFDAEFGQFEIFYQLKK